MKNIYVFLIRVMVVTMMSVNTLFTNILHGNY